MDDLFRAAQRRFRGKLAFYARCKLLAEMEESAVKEVKVKLYAIPTKNSHGAASIRRVNNKPILDDSPWYNGSFDNVVRAYEEDR